MQRDWCIPNWKDNPHLGLNLVGMSYDIKSTIDDYSHDGFVS